MNILVEESWVSFLVVSGLLGCGAAWMSGRSLALGWRPLWMALAYMLPLGAAVRFFHYSLGDGSLLSVHYFLVDTVLLMVVAAIAHRVTEAGLMVRQYPWLYRRTSPLSWTSIDGQH